jgi:hypothetical protein
VSPGNQFFSNSDTIRVCLKRINFTLFSRCLLHYTPSLVVKIKKTGTFGFFVFLAVIRNSFGAVIKQKRAWTKPSKMKLLRIGPRVEPAGLLAGSALDGAGAVDLPRPASATLDASAHSTWDQPCELSPYSAKTGASFASIATSPMARSPEDCGLGARSSHPEVTRPSPSALRLRQKWWLQLRVAAALNLPRATGVGIWSCFCVVRLGNQEHRTSLRHGGGGSDLGWADDAWVHLQVHDRAQLLTIMLLAYDGAESRVIGSAKIAPVLATMSNDAPRKGQACVQSSQVAEGCVETTRCLSLMGVNGRILCGRDAKRYIRIMIIIMTIKRTIII